MPKGLEDKFRGVGNQGLYLLDADEICKRRISDSGKDEASSFTAFPILYPACPMKQGCSRKSTTKPSHHTNSFWGTQVPHRTYLGQTCYSAKGWSFAAGIRQPQAVPVCCSWSGEE